MKDKNPKTLLTKTDLKLIRKVMEAYAQEQHKLHVSGKFDKHARAFNLAAAISRYKLADF